MSVPHDGRRVSVLIVHSRGAAADDDSNDDLPPSDTGIVSGLLARKRKTPVGVAAAVRLFAGLCKIVAAGAAAVGAADGIEIVHTAAAGAAAGIVNDGSCAWTYPVQLSVVRYS